MARAGMRVRRADEHDLDTVLALNAQLRDQLLLGRGRVPGRTAVERYAEVLADETCEIVLAVADGPGRGEEVVGMAVLTQARSNALLDLPALHVTHVVVSAPHRRRGAGRALVAAAAAYAEEHGLEQLVVSVHPGSRDAARFFARLGFAPLSVRRTAPVAVVRRRLAAGELAERGTDSTLRRARRLPGRAVRPRPVDTPGS